MSDDKATTHERLLQEAATLFARRGYCGTSMADIAREVGVRKPSLYNYYPSKADLLLDLVERSLNAWTAACDHSQETVDDLEGRLAAHLRSAVEFSQTNPQAIALIRLATAQVPGDVRRRVKSLYGSYEAHWHAQLTRLFQEAVDRGELHSSEPSTLALFWGVILDGILVNRVFATDLADPVTDNLQALWEFSWRGISGTNPHTEI